MTKYVDEVRQQLLVAAEAGGDDVRAAADRLVAATAPVVHLVVLDALGDAAAELTADLAPGSVELRLRGREPSWVVTLPATDHPSTPDAEPTESAPSSTVDADDTEVARINLRLPKALKDRVEQAASRDGLSINAWLVRAVAVAADPKPPARPRRAASGSDRMTGWAR